MNILHIATDGNQVFAIVEVRAVCEDRGIPVFLSLIRFDFSRREEVLEELLKTGYLTLSNAWGFEERLGRASLRYAKTFEVRASHFADYRYQGPRSRYGKAMAVFVQDMSWNLKDSVLHEVKSDYSCDIRAFTEEAARRAHRARLDEVLSEGVQSSQSRVRL
ncbi:hypothetical protein QEG23_002114 [Stenotrophomonas maltophilia]|uniref:Uncharacterized protein n=1 Tax=Stenotrophomonas maltophilia TaxID=40324 RepID=A0AAI9BZM0_STEMA|nr:hypothetical protein [Stenotrophomonas maltophilia]